MTTNNLPATLSLPERYNTLPSYVSEHILLLHSWGKSFRDQVPLDFEVLREDRAFNTIVNCSSDPFLMRRLVWSLVRTVDPQNPAQANKGLSYDLIEEFLTKPEIRIGLFCATTPTYLATSQDGNSSALRNCLEATREHKLRDKILYAASNPNYCDLVVAIHSALAVDDIVAQKTLTFLEEQGRSINTKITQLLKKGNKEDAEKVADSDHKDSCESIVYLIKGIRNAIKKRPYLATDSGADFVQLLIDWHSKSYQKHTLAKVYNSDGVSIGCEKRPSLLDTILADDFLNCFDSLDQINPTFGKKVTGELTRVLDKYLDLCPFDQHVVNWLERYIKSAVQTFSLKSVRSLAQKVRKLPSSFQTEFNAALFRNLFLADFEGHREYGIDEKPKYIDTRVNELLEYNMSKFLNESTRLTSEERASAIKVMIKLAQYGPAYCPGKHVANDISGLFMEGLFKTKDKVFQKITADSMNAAAIILSRCDVHCDKENGTYTRHNEGIDKKSFFRTIKLIEEINACLEKDDLDNCVKKLGELNELANQNSRILFSGSAKGDINREISF